MVPWNSARTKVQIRLSIQRLRTLQDKKLALAKKSRREIADLLLKGRVETAKLRVEGLIQDDIYVELLELIELYAEKLQARFNLLDASTGEEPEPSISDAVCAIIYAAPRTDLKELQVLREMLMHKYGRNFSLTLLPSDPPPSTVPSRILSKLALFTPAQELVDAYLWEIAKGYGVDWTPEGPVDDSMGQSSEKEGYTTDEAEKAGSGNGGKNVGDEDGDEGGDGDGDGGGGGRGEPISMALPVPPSDSSATKGRTPSPRVGNEPESPKDAPGGGGEKAKTTPAAAPPAAAAPKKLSEEEELAKRFERLKNLR